MKRVYVLGAGFSKAINGAMPMLGDLSRQVAARLGEEGDKARRNADLYGGDVERWLSALAEPGPWLDDVDHLRSLARFYEVSAAVAEVIEKQERETLRGGAGPDWLPKLVQSWHDERPTVVTFNYDRLVEIAYGGVLQDVTRNSFADLYSIPLTNAALRTSGTYGEEPEKPTFRLLKLHGSIAWYYSGPSGGPHEPIYITPWRGEFGDDVRLINDRVTTLVEDKKPFIVPPAAAKSSFYANRLLASQWKQAAKALQDLTPADELVLMGYSLPPTDLTVTSLIATRRGGRPLWRGRSRRCGWRPGRTGCAQAGSTKLAPANPGSSRCA